MKNLLLLSVISPLFIIELQIGVGIYCDLEVSTSASREEIAVYFLEGDSRIQVNGVLLQLCLLQYQHRHKLPEQFAHGFHARHPGLHVIYGMAHGEKHRLHATRVRCVIDVRISVGYVGHTDESGAALHLSQSFLEALNPLTLQKVKRFCCAKMLRLVRSEKNAVAFQL